MSPATFVPYSSSDQRWQATIDRDSAADGRFVYAVATTGVYCRPTCSSRRPNRSNVRFFSSWQQAERAGFRACRKCRPHTTGDDTVLRACRMIEQADQPLPLTELAERVGLSPSHFHRLFQKSTGLTPKVYAAAVRAKRLRKELQDAGTITEALYSCGFGASSRLYETARSELGMTPSAFQQAGAGQTIRHAVARCHLGWLLIAATDFGVCAIELDDSPARLRKRLRARFAAAVLKPAEEAFQAWVEQVLALVSAPERGLDLPLDIRGTVFQRKVWKALQAVPAGKTATYSEIARRIGQPKAARAVAAACAANPLAVAIPCHRVIRSDGQRSGYRWGAERKEKLLDLESGTSPQ